MLKNISHSMLFILALALMVGNSVATVAYPLRMQVLIQELTQRQTQFHAKYFDNSTNTGRKTMIMQITNLPRLSIEVKALQKMVQDMKNEREDFQNMWQMAQTFYNENLSFMKDTVKVQTAMMELQIKMSADWSMSGKIYGFTLKDVAVIRDNLKEACVEPNCTTILRNLNPNA